MVAFIISKMVVVVLLVPISAWQPLLLLQQSSAAAAAALAFPTTSTTTAVAVVSNVCSDAQLLQRCDARTTPCVIPNNNICIQRRTWMLRQAALFAVTATTTTATLIAAPTPLRAIAATAATTTPMTASPSSLTLSSSSSSSSSSSWSDVKAPIQDAADTLEKLVQNWERAVIDCTYADVPRELLEQKNKELLLEKASTFALFDKSVSVVSCKTVVGTVRDYLGRTGIGPVVGLDRNLKAALTRLFLSSDDDATTMDPDQVDALVQTVEDVQRDLTRADSLSYSARRDFYSMNNFDPALASSVLADPTTGNLQQCKAAIQAAIDKLRIILKSLPSD